MWQYRKFEKCLDKVPTASKIPKKAFLEDGGYPIISQEKDFINGYWDQEDDLFKVNKPIVIFGDHTQIIKYVDFDFVVGADGVKILQPVNEIDAKFLYYFIATNPIKSLGYARHYRLLKELSVPVPPLEEQKRIVAILDEAFAGIDEAIAHTEQNIQNARDLFESHLNTIFTQKGEGWVEKKLGDSDLIQIIDGDRGSNYPKKSDFQDEGFCLFLNTKNVRPDGFNFDTRMFISKEKDKLLRKGKLQRRDVLLTTRGTIGHIALYSDDVEFDEIRINSGMLIFRPNEKIITSEYLFEILRSSIIKSQIKMHVSGAAQPQLPIKTLVNFTIPVPLDLNEQLNLVSKLQSLLIESKKSEAIYQQKLTALKDLKQSLLQQAFAGELTSDLSEAA